MTNMTANKLSPSCKNGKLANRVKPFTAHASHEIFPIVIIKACHILVIGLKYVVEMLPGIRKSYLQQPKRK